MDKKIFHYWYSDFTEFVKNVIGCDNRKVVVIALSRKMPRLISWILNEVFSEEQVEYFNSLIYNRQCIYTTEHAIPFIFSQHEIKEAEVLILDDMFVTGETIQGVSDEIFALTGRRPNFLSLYAYVKNQRKDVGFPSVGTNISKELPKQLNNIREAREIMREFSEMIENTQLPIDMEFPILHISKVFSELTNENDDVLEVVINELKEKQPQARSFLRKPEKLIVDFTQLVEKDVNRLYNNDFAKLRLFRHHDEVRLVCYAPNILCDGQIMDTTLFSNENYRWIWQDLLESNCMDDPVKGRYDYIISKEDLLRHKLSLRLHKSLVVFANYMFSLSMMIRQKSDYVEALQNSKYKVELREEDLALLIGPHLANRYIQRLNDLYVSSTTSESIRQELKLPDLLATDNVMAEYKFLSTSEIFKANSVEDAINKVFAVAYRVCADFREQYDSSIKGEYILESFQSLYSKPSALFQGVDKELEINLVIDQLIDKGYVVPVYERVKNENNAFYWRRFFRATHTAPLLLS